MIPSKLKPFTPLAANLLAATFLVIFLNIRNCGLYPSVFDDEWIYSKFSRLAPRSQAPVPCYLFFSLFKTTRLFGQGFLECARIYNVCFFAIALFFIYRVCRNYASPGIALFIALLSVLGPINTYSAYFMPESMYFCAFWIFAWFLLRNIRESPWILGLGTGVILGLMALIKFHAIFLLAGFTLFVVLVWLTKSANLTFKSVIQLLLLAPLTFFVVRFAGGYLLADTAGLHLAGYRYGSFASSSDNSSHLSNILSLSRHSLAGHLIALSFLLGAPLAATISLAWKTGSSDAPDVYPRLLPLFGLSFLPTLLLVAALSTAMFANGSPYDTIDRLHLRYYNFIFPLFFIIAASELNAEHKAPAHSRLRLAAALIVGIAGLFAILAGLRNYRPNIVDSPELLILYNRQVFLLSGVAGILSVLIWSVERRLGAVLYLFLFLPAAMAGATQRATAELGARRVADAYDDAGRFARQVLGRKTSRLAIAGSDELGLYKALFQVDNPNASILVIAPSAPLHLSQIPAGKNWALIIGDHQPLLPARYRISLGAYTLVQISPDNVIDFRDNAWPGILNEINGLSTVEEFGRWTLGDETTMEFVSPLPRRFTLLLRARAIGPNIGLPFKIIVGPQEQQFRLAESLGEVALSFATDGTDRIMKIKVPKPISPKQLWNIPDERPLGAAMEQLSILERPATE